MKSTKNNEVNVGVDTGKTQLDIFIRPSGKHFTVPNTIVGIRQAIRRLKPHAPVRIVIEATGRLEQPFVLACAEHGLPVCVVNPIATRRFAGAIGQIAKTDKINARLIAHFGEAIRPEPTAIQPENVRLISDLLTRRRQLLEMSTMEKNRLHILPKALQSSIRAVLETLQNQIACIDQQLDCLIDATQEWKVKNEILQSVPGIGKVMAYRDCSKFCVSICLKRQVWIEPAFEVNGELRQREVPVLNWMGPLLAGVQYTGVQEFQ